MEGATLRPRTCLRQRAARLGAPVLGAIAGLAFLGRPPRKRISSLHFRRVINDVEATAPLIGGNQEPLHGPDVGPEERDDQPGEAGSWRVPSSFQPRPIVRDAAKP